MFTHEVISYNENLPIKLFFQRLGDAAKHWHKSMELLLVLEGELTVIVESESFLLKEGDLILINPLQIHETHGKDCTIATLQIRLSMFHGSHVHENAQFNCNSSLYQNKDRFSNLLSILAHLVQLNSSDSAKDRGYLLTISYAYAIMHELMLNFYVPDGHISVHTTETLQRLKDITSFIDEHYAENITLKTMAERQFLSASYLSYFFEKNMNITFSAYLTSIRLEHATQELLTTDHYIEEIAANNGFPNSRAFVTAFRKQYHVLPSQYRTNIETQASEQVLHTSGTNNYLELKKHDILRILSKYLEKTKDNPQKQSDFNHFLGSHNIDATSEGIILKHNFKVFTSVGRASDLFKQEVRDMLCTLQKEVGYQYIKFHGILDDSMMLYREDSTGNPILSFEYVDNAIDFLRSIGLRPLIQFSFMPRDLALYPERLLFANPVIISPPKDESKWCFLIEELTLHFIHRYGKEEVRKWLFTFWNETLSPSPFSLGTQEEVFHLYELTYRSVKKCDKKLLFGNPSVLATYFPNNAFSQFLSRCKKHKCLPDFHVLHFYPISNKSAQLFKNMSREELIDLKSEDYILSQDPDFMNKFVCSYHSFASDYPNTKAYLTEWSSTTSHRDFLNDTCYRSAYICKNILENYDELDSFGNWTLTDLIEELPLTDELFHGGMGLFTRNGIKKPAYHAFVFLNKLDNILLRRDKGYFITTDGNGNYTILLYNYNHFSSFYAQGILFDSSPESRYDVFPDPQTMDAELTLENIENEIYCLTEEIVNRNYGSCYDEWVRMGAEPLTSPEEIAILKARSAPMLLKSTIEVQDNKISYFAHLEPHEIRLTKFVKKNK